MSARAEQFWDENHFQSNIVKTSTEAGLTHIPSAAGIAGAKAACEKIQHHPDRKVLGELSLNAANTFLQFSQLSVRPKPAACGDFSNLYTLNTSGSFDIKKMPRLLPTDTWEGAGGRKTEWEAFIKTARTYEEMQHVILVISEEDISEIPERVSELIEERCAHLKIKSPMEVAKNSAVLLKNLNAALKG